MESFKNWMIEAANILFDDSKNDLRALPKTVRLQILLVLSFIWTTVFSLYVFSYTTFAFGWAGLFLAHKPKFSWFFWFSFALNAFETNISTNMNNKIIRLNAF